MPEELKLGAKYTREQIAGTLGGSEISYLPRVGGTVVCGCFTFDDNPQLPEIILPGTRRDIEEEAAEFRKGYPVPVFVKLATNQWVYVGHYRVAKWSTDPSEVQKHQLLLGREPKGRDKISQVLYLAPVGDHFDLTSATIVAR